MTRRPPGRNSPAARAMTRARYRQPVRPSAVQRDLRVIVANLGVDRFLTRRDVRRVAHHDVDPAEQVGEHRPVAGSVTSAARRSTRPGARASMFAAAQARARSLTSTATTVVPATSMATAKAIAAEPAQRSTTTAPPVEPTTDRAAAIAAPATSSVSGRGTKTPGPTGQLEIAKRRPAGEVLQRHPLRPLGHQLGRIRPALRCRRGARAGLSRTG